MDSVELAQGHPCARETSRAPGLPRGIRVRIRVRVPYFRIRPQTTALMIAALFYLAAVCFGWLFTIQLQR